MTEPCRFTQEIENLTKIVFIGNGHESLTAQMSGISEKVDNIRESINEMKEAADKRNTMTMSAVGICVAVFGLYLGYVKMDEAKVKAIVQQTTKAENDKIVNDAKNANWEKEKKR
jgi:hypothetical protein